ncbi:MAG TPA: alpha/beta hydrolase [Candidatus Saccharimonadales bacterium]|nr:alpha/beta hydrolase [Candidatus Saccharimonadales bacterium]
MKLFDIWWHKWLGRPYALSVQETGKGKPLVLLHGIASSHVKWRPLIRDLQGDPWWIIAPDLLGFGDSPKPRWNDYTVQEHARMVLALLKRKKVRGPVTIVGHSMGCLVAAHIAATRPGFVERLVLHEPPLFGEPADYPLYSKRSSRYLKFFEYLASHPQLMVTYNALAWRIVRKTLGLYLDEEQWPPFERSLRNTIMKQRAYGELQSLAVPTHIVHGRLDFVVIRTDLRSIFKSNKHITWHKVTDSHGVSKRTAKYLARLLNTPVIFSSASERATRRRSRKL